MDTNCPLILTLVNKEKERASKKDKFLEYFYAIHIIKLLK